MYKSSYTSFRTTFFVSVIFFALTESVCDGECDFFQVFITHTTAGVCTRPYVCVGVDARSLCPGIVKNVVLDSSSANE